MLQIYSDVAARLVERKTFAEMGHPASSCRRTSQRPAIVTEAFFAFFA
jgi:hypothetical protein